MRGAGLGLAGIFETDRGQPFFHTRCTNCCTFVDSKLFPVQDLLPSTASVDGCWPAAILLSSSCAGPHGHRSSSPRFNRVRCVVGMICVEFHKFTSLTTSKCTGQ